MVRLKCAYSEGFWPCSDGWNAQRATISFDDDSTDQRNCSSSSGGGGDSGSSLIRRIERSNGKMRVHTCGYYVDKTMCAVRSVSLAICVSGHTCSRVHDDFRFSVHFVCIFFLLPKCCWLFVLGVALRFSFFVYKLLVITMKLTENYPLASMRAKSAICRDETRDPRTRTRDQRPDRPNANESKRMKTKMHGASSEKSPSQASRPSNGKIAKFLLLLRAEYAHNQFIVFGG